MDDAIHTDPTDPHFHDDQVVLLTGTIANMYLKGGKNLSDASILSSPLFVDEDNPVDYIPGSGVTYNGGVILDAWKAANNYSDPTVMGGTTWNLTLSANSKMVALSGNVRLQQFDSNMGASFSAPQVPEPASVTLLALAGVGLLGRFRKQKVRIQ